MRFKKGDTIMITSAGRFSSAVPWANSYTVRGIASGAPGASFLDQDQYYVLSTGSQVTMHDVALIDKEFDFSIKDTLKKL
jgi:hypothetical protein